jgi:hypothetical protein
MIEKYFNKNIDDKRLIWILIVRCFSIDEHRDLFVFYDLPRWWISMSNSIHIWVVFMSWDEYHEMRLFVNRSVELSCWDLLLIFWFARWRSESSRWIDESDWSKISWGCQASLLDLRGAMRWLGVAYPYSGRGRNTSILWGLATIACYDRFWMLATTW